MSTTSWHGQCQQQQAYDQAVGFEHWVKDRLAESELIHGDETGINIGGKRHWLHCVSNDRLNLLAPHAKRGQQAMDEIGTLPRFQGVLCHAPRSLETVLPL